MLPPRTDGSSFEAVRSIALTVVFWLRHLEVVHLEDGGRRRRTQLELSLAAERQRCDEEHEVPGGFHPLRLRRLLEPDQ